MAVHLEFVVPGPPVSHQQSTVGGRRNLAVWRALLIDEARRRWPGTPLAGPLKAVVLNFHVGVDPTIDVDNMAKPIFDELQGVAYENDRQIRQATMAHARIGAPYAIVGVSKLIVDGLQAGNQFVYIRIEDPEDPYPLPR